MQSERGGPSMRPVRSGHLRFRSGGLHAVRVQLGRILGQLLRRLNGTGPLPAQYVRPGVRPVPAGLLELPVVPALRVQRPRRPVRLEDGPLSRLPRLDDGRPLRQLFGHFLRRSAPRHRHPLPAVPLPRYGRLGSLVRSALLPRPRDAGRGLRMRRGLRWTPLRRLRRQLLWQSGNSWRSVPLFFFAFKMFYKILNLFPGGIQVNVGRASATTTLIYRGRATATAGRASVSSASSIRKDSAAMCAKRVSSATPLRSSARPACATCSAAIRPSKERPSATARRANAPACPTWRACLATSVPWITGKSHPAKGMKDPFENVCHPLLI